MARTGDQTNNPSPIMSDNKPCQTSGRFCWNELVTTDETAAKAFYGQLFGWKTEPFGDGSYKLFINGEDKVGGLIQCPKPGIPAHWLAYVTVNDVNAIVAHTLQLGGKVVVEPFDVPTIGRLAVLVDPQGAPIAVIQPAMAAS